MFEFRHLAPGDPGRIARVSAKAGSVCIRKPLHGPSPADPATVTLTYVEVNETNPPEGS